MNIRPRIGWRTRRSVPGTRTPDHDPTGTCPRIHRLQATGYAHSVLADLFAAMGAYFGLPALSLHFFEEAGSKDACWQGEHPDA